MKIFVSDELKELRAILRRHEDGGMVLDPVHVTAAIRRMNTLIELAKEQEFEVSRLQCNEQAAIEQRQRSSPAARIRKVMAQPGSNVVFFRAHDFFGQGETPSGGAA